MYWLLNMKRRLNLLEGGIISTLASCFMRGVAIFWNFGKGLTNQIWSRNLFPNRVSVYLSLLFAITQGAASFSVGMAAPLRDLDSPTEPPARQKTITVFNDHEWWLVQWQDNNIVCRLSVTHDEYPSDDEITYFCGEQIYKQWLDTPACPQSQDESENNSGEDQTISCQGIYLQKNISRPEERQVIVDLPTPSVRISLPDCTYAHYTFYCPNSPTLLLTAEEPLPNEHIVSVYYTVDNATYVCNGELCLVPLTQTSEIGSQISFWATSSYGDESEHFVARIRVIDLNSQGQTGWQVNVLSSQLDGGDLPCCSLTWGAFPSSSNVPSWLQTPEQLGALASNEPYVYLAGRLIAGGIVDASDCPGYGLLPNGSADACGLEKSRAEVNSWQNQFDAEILRVSKATGVPGQLLKNIIAQESQFWPGTFDVSTEHGLGRMTEMGADTVLLWNPSFFQEFCPLVLGNQACQNGYANLGPSDQALVRGALVVEVGTGCPDCPYGFDLEHAHFSIHLLAQSLLASCAQVDQTIYNIILYNTQGLEPSEVSTFEDLWRFTLVNYNAGPGCLADAIYRAWMPGNQLTWNEVAASLSGGCRGAIQYVEQVTRE